jgi:hypothetical protein
MEGKTLLRVTIVVLCLAVTGLGYQNSNGDNSDVVPIATRAACDGGAPDCTASLGQTARSSFGHEYLFHVLGVKGGTPGIKRDVVIECKRAAIFVGDWTCKPKP